MALVSVTLCDDKINFMGLSWREGLVKSSPVLLKADFFLREAISLHLLQAVREIRQQLLLARNDPSQFIDARLDFRVANFLAQFRRARDEQQRRLHHHV